VAVAVAVAVELSWAVLCCWFVKIKTHLPIYTPRKIKQVSKEKKDRTQVKNDSSELFTVLII
jgi:uncharacterized membrane protein YciS (DUF1049 family)